MVWKHLVLHACGILGESELACLRGAALSIPIALESGDPAAQLAEALAWLSGAGEALGSVGGQDTEALRVERVHGLISRARDLAVPS